MAFFFREGVWHHSIFVISQNIKESDTHVSRKSCIIQPIQRRLLNSWSVYTLCAICIRRLANIPWMWRLRLRLAPNQLKPAHGKLRTSLSQLKPAAMLQNMSNMLFFFQQWSSQKHLVPMNAPRDQGSLLQYFQRLSDEQREDNHTELQKKKNFWSEL